MRAFTADGTINDLLDRWVGPDASGGEAVLDPSTSDDAVSPPVLPFAITLPSPTGGPGSSWSCSWW